VDRVFQCGLANSACSIGLRSTTISINPGKADSAVMAKNMDHPT
jgi:hypothetical protein